MSEVKSFRDLLIWQKGVELVKDIYSLTAGFPRNEIYGLSSQMQKAAVSVPSNIAEGFRRSHKKEYAQFLSIALGSLGELETQVEISKKLGYLGESVYQKTITDIEILCKMIQSLLKKVRVAFTPDSRLTTID